ncbi:hypothetical protein [Corallibacter sp.]|uniref:hypothetical protein n=1 Tax=Corallibacter sp. TaxID=2038084 RepID=UPI003AB5ACB0
MKINKPPKAFLGHIYVEYTGNNVVLLNSNNDKFFQNVNIFDYLPDRRGGHIKRCFKIELLDSKYILEFENMSVYKYDEKANNYVVDDWSLLMEYITFTNRDLFMISGKFHIYNEINDTDGRNETFSFNLILDNKEEITNLFK